MMSFDEDEATLTLDSYLLLKAEDKVVQEVINSLIYCDKLVVLGTASTFHGSFLGTASYEKFWMKLGDTVTYLEVYERTNIDLGSYLPNVKYLYIEKPGIFQDILRKFSDKNVELYELHINENVIDYGHRTPNEMYVNHEFFRMLQPFRISLKCVTFECLMYLRKCYANALRFDLKKIFEDLDEVMFDCEQLPYFTAWLLEKIRIEFVKEGTSNTLIIKPLSLQEFCPSSFLGDSESLLNEYNLNHGMLCASVKTLCFKDVHRCFNYYRNTFATFPSVVKVTDLTIRDKAVLDLLSNMNHLRDLSLIYEGGYKDTWPSCKTVENVTIKCVLFNYKKLGGLIKCFPNLRKLSVRFLVCLESTPDNVVKVIAENSKKLEYLYIHCKHKKTTRFGLHFIRHLKELKELHVNCSESLFVKETLFEELPSLEVFKHGPSTLLRRFLKCQPLPHEKHINDLPLELLEQIFLNLTANEQRICRLVCTYWFNIQKASPKVNHTLDLKQSHLSYSEEPVKTFINTNFNYNLIIFHGTTFATDEDLTAFWEKIGSEVVEICFKTYLNDDLNFTKAVQSGFRVYHVPKMKKLTINDLSLFYHLLQQDSSEFEALLNQVENFYIDCCFFPNLSDNIRGSMSSVTHLTIFCGDEATKGVFQSILFPNLKTLIVVSVSTKLPIFFNFNINFGQINTFFFEDMENPEDFDLIAKSCPNLEWLGTKIQKKVVYNYDIEAKKMFYQLVYLKDLYFVEMWKSDERSFLSFHRTDFGFEKSNKSCRVLHDIFTICNNRG